MNIFFPSYEMNIFNHAFFQDVFSYRVLLHATLIPHYSILVSFIFVVVDILFSSRIDCSFSATIDHLLLFIQNNNQ